MDRTASIEAACSAFVEKEHELRIFMEGVGQWFGRHPKLSQPSAPIVHSVKSRLKATDHFREKIERKWDINDPITVGNLFFRVTDLAGVRVLHLYQDQFAVIHNEIMAKVERLQDWYLDEAPKAFTWDPESRAFFEKLDIFCQLYKL